MRKRTVSNPKNSPRIQRERDPLPWRYCFLTLVCGLLLVAGFFLAARQHFSVMDYAIKNAKLRREKENLESEQRRLYLTREISLSPAEIKKAAKKLGLHDLTAQSIEIMMPKKPTNDSARTLARQPETEKSTKNDKDFERKTVEKVEKKDAKESKTKTSLSSVASLRPQPAKK